MDPMINMIFDKKAKKYTHMNMLVKQNVRRFDITEALFVDTDKSGHYPRIETGVNYKLRLISTSKQMVTVTVKYVKERDKWFLTSAPSEFPEMMLTKPEPRGFRSPYSYEL